MNAGWARGLRRALVGWMRPRVKRVGAMQMATGVVAVGRCSRGCPGIGGPWRRSGTSSTRAWSYRERWWEWDFGEAAVWVILRLSRRDGSSGLVSRGAM